MNRDYYRLAIQAGHLRLQSIGGEFLDPRDFSGVRLGKNSRSRRIRSGCASMLVSG